MTTFWTDIETPLGGMLAASDGHALTGLWFDGQKHFPARTVEFVRDDRLPLFTLLRSALADYFAARRAMRPAAAHFALAPRGTAFQKRAWAALCDIPSGTTCTYADFARRVGAPKAVRAVGAAIGRNPISILVPCHRVVGSKGALTGYAGGLKRKRALLALEGVPSTSAGGTAVTTRIGAAHERVSGRGMLA